MGERAVGHEATRERARAHGRAAARVARARAASASRRRSRRPTTTATASRCRRATRAARSSSRSRARSATSRARRSSSSRASGIWGEQEKALMADLSLAANRPLNWNVLAPNSARAAVRRGAARGLRLRGRARRAGGRADRAAPDDACASTSRRGFVFDALPGWAELFRLPIPERDARLRDPAVRRQLDEGANSEGAGLLRGLARWENMIVDQVARPEHEGLRGRRDRRASRRSSARRPSTRCSTSRSRTSCAPRFMPRADRRRRRELEAARRSRGATRAR